MSPSKLEPGAAYCINCPTHQLRGRLRGLCAHQQENATKINTLIHLTQRLDILRDAIIQDLAHRYESPNRWRDEDANDLALFFGSGVAVEVEGLEHEQDEACCDGRAYCYPSH